MNVLLAVFALARYLLEQPILLLAKLKTERGLTMIRPTAFLLLAVLLSGCGPFHADMAISWGASSIKRDVVITNPQEPEDEEIIITKPALPLKGV